MGNIQNSTHLSTSKKILLILTIVLIITTIRLYPTYQYSSEPDSYKGAGVLQQNTIITTGHLPSLGRGEALLTVYGLEKRLIIPPFPPYEQYIYSFFLGITFILVIILFARHRSDRSNSQLDTKSLVILTIFGLCATPDIIMNLGGWNGPYAWIFLLLFLYYAVYKEHTITNMGLAIFFLLLLPITYFTIALITGSMLLTTLCYQKMFNKEVIPESLIIFYVIFFIGYQIYATVFGFDLLANMDSIVFSYFEGSSRVLELKYTLGGSKISFFACALSNFLACIPLFFFIVRGDRDSKSYDLIIVLILNLAIISAGFYLWMGYYGVVQRIPYLTVLTSILAVALMIRTGFIKENSSKNMTIRTIIVLSIVCAVVISNIFNVSSEYYEQKIEFTEAAGLTWLKENSLPEDIIFTDFRLAGSLIAHKNPTLFIDDNAMSPERVNWLLENIYYNEGDPIQALDQIKTNEGRTSDILFFSEKFTRFPGIKGYDNIFQPASKDFLDPFMRSDNINLVYRNDETMVLIKNN